MSLGQRSGKKLFLLVMVFALALMGGTFAHAQTTSSASTDADHVFGQEGSFEESIKVARPNESPTLFGIISRIIVFLFVLTGVAVGVIHYAKKGKFNLSALKPVGTENRLLILETKMLGSRQYLSVIEYNEQKMLVGVSPGKIEHLCFLESVYEEDERADEFELERDIN